MTVLTNQIDQAKALEPEVYHTEFTESMTGYELFQTWRNQIWTPADAHLPAVQKERLECMLWYGAKLQRSEYANLCVLLKDWLQTVSLQNGDTAKFAITAVKYIIHDYNIRSVLLTKDILYDQLDHIGKRPTNMRIWMALCDLVHLAGIEALDIKMRVCVDLNEDGTIPLFNLCTLDMALYTKFIYFSGTIYHNKTFNPRCI